MIDEEAANQTLVLKSRSGSQNSERIEASLLPCGPEAFQAGSKNGQPGAKK